jgi:hypothetical protein
MKMDHLPTFRNGDFVLASGPEYRPRRVGRVVDTISNNSREVLVNVGTGVPKRISRAYLTEVASCHFPRWFKDCDDKLAVAEERAVKAEAECERLQEAYDSLVNLLGDTRIRAEKAEAECERLRSRVMEWSENAALLETEKRELDVIFNPPMGGEG